MCSTQIAGRNYVLVTLPHLVRRPLIDQLGSCDSCTLSRVARVAWERGVGVTQRMEQGNKPSTLDHTYHMHTHGIKRVQTQFGEEQLAIAM